MPSEVVTIRPCRTIEEFEQMVELEIQVWGFVERDVVPSQMYVVASKVGGQVLGAFVEGKDGRIRSCLSWHPRWQAIPPFAHGCGAS